MTAAFARKPGEDSGFSRKYIDLVLQIGKYRKPYKNQDEFPQVRDILQYFAHIRKTILCTPTDFLISS